MARLVTAAELQEHNSDQSTWIVVNDVVYDMTRFALEHPGGSESRLSVVICFLAEC